MEIKGKTIISILQNRDERRHVHAWLGPALDHPGLFSQAIQAVSFFFQQFLLTDEKSEASHPPPNCEIQSRVATAGVTFVGAKAGKATALFWFDRSLSLGLLSRFLTLCRVF